MRLFVLTTLVLLTLSFSVPAASAGPGGNCLQVYPWSELCQGDVDGFLCAMGVCPAFAGPSAPSVPVDCIQVIPWSYLCSGNVEAFVAYFVGDVVVLS